jgi:hypothetical protein
LVSFFNALWGGWVGGFFTGQVIQMFH